MAELCIFEGKCRIKKLKEMDIKVFIVLIESSIYYFQGFQDIHIIFEIFLKTLKRFFLAAYSINISYIVTCINVIKYV